MAHVFKIKGADALSTYGLRFLEDVYDELLRFPKIKPGVENNWQDQHGTERDVTASYLESNEFNLKMLLHGANAVDFQSKYAAFIAFFSTPGYFNLDVVFLNRRYRLLNRGISETRVLNNRAMEFTWQLVDDFPQTVTPIS